MEPSQYETAFDLSDVNVVDGQSFEVARPKRLTVAYAMLLPSYASVVDRVKYQDSKASALSGWIGAIIALVVGHAMSNAPSDAGQRLLMFIYLGLLIASFFTAIRAVFPGTARSSALLPLSEIYKYQSDSCWDQLDLRGDQTADETAEAQTQKMLLTETEKAIRAYREVELKKVDLIRKSLWLFGAGITVLAVAALFRGSY